MWGTDPDGNKWEVYLVLDNAAARRRSSQSASCADQPDCCEGKAGCCTPVPGSDEAVRAVARPFACACSV